MSATKQYYEQFFEEGHHDFVTDDAYQDFLRMQQEHQMQEKLNVVEQDEEIVVQRTPQSQINWEKQANEFLGGKCQCLHEIQNNLPRTKFCTIPCLAQRKQSSSNDLPF